MTEREVQYLLVGGGVASVKASMGIREIDRDGTILIVRGEATMPYDRPPLSKGILMGQMEPEDAESKDPTYYEENRVELMLGSKTESVDLPNRTASLSDGTRIRYEKLLIATGSRPRRPAIAGLDLPGVHLLREMGDSLAIRESMHHAKRVVMVGAGYIGMEVGADCLAKGMEVTFIDPVSHPWGRLVSPACGGFLRRHFEAKGARFHMGDSVASIQGQQRVTTVTLESGDDVPADLVVVGVGIDRNLELAAEAGLAMHHHGVVVDETLRTSDQNVWAAGDIAAFIEPTAGQRWHHEHHLNADWQGKQAGRNMAGAGEPYDRVAYFFSDMDDIHMALRGCPNVGESAKIIGDVDAGEFVELYARDDGTLCMGLVFSHDEGRLDPVSDWLEKALSHRENVETLAVRQIGAYLG